jgi:single-strand DNA-binding protein
LRRCPHHSCERGFHYTTWTDQQGTDRYGCEIIAEQVDFLAKAKEPSKDEPKKRRSK